MAIAIVIVEWFERAVCRVFDHKPRTLHRITYCTRCLTILDQPHEPT